MKMQINEFARLTGVSVRTLHYYDEIGLLTPAYVDKFTGYRYYDENSILRMQEILFYRELDFSLKSIMNILSAPDYDKEKALNEQKKLLVLKKERLERLISAIDSAKKGENIMSAFDNTKFENYKDEVKEKWGKTEAYKEYNQKTKGYSKDKFNAMADVLFRYGYTKADYDMWDLFVIQTYHDTERYLEIHNGDLEAAYNDMRYDF
jgi:DNA-binding transcriptional MerR regulator